MDEKVNKQWRKISVLEDTIVNIFCLVETLVNLEE